MSYLKNVLPFEGFHFPGWNRNPSLLWPFYFFFVAAQCTYVRVPCCAHITVFFFCHPPFKTKPQIVCISKLRKPCLHVRWRIPWLGYIAFQNRCNACTCILYYTVVEAISIKLRSFFCFSSYQSYLTLLFHFIVLTALPIRIPIASYLRHRLLSIFTTFFDDSIGRIWKEEKTKQLNWSYCRHRSHHSCNISACWPEFLVCDVFL